jgi:hypothetical protein
MCGEIYLYFGLKMGLTFDEAMDMPRSLLDDLIATDQIVEQGFKRKLSPEENAKELKAIFRLR